jgi:hypothetical protein
MDPCDFSTLHLGNGVVFAFLVNLVAPVSLDLLGDHLLTVVVVRVLCFCFGRCDGVATERADAANHNDGSQEALLAIDFHKLVSNLSFGFTLFPPPDRTCLNQGFSECITIYFGSGI